MKEALKLALSRLEWFIDSYPHDITTSKEEFLRPFKEALAQQEQEPVDVSELKRLSDAIELRVETRVERMVIADKLRKLAYTTPPQPEQEPVGFYDARGNDICIEIPMGESGDWWQPVYTTPPQRTWVGLTPENYNWIFEQARTGEHAVQLAEAKLKENNA